MQSLHYFFNILIHLERYLVEFVAQYGNWTYALVTAIIFCETGLVVTPFLPGDALLFALGSLAAQPGEPLSAMTLFFLLMLAAFLGNQVNYRIGRYLGPRVFEHSSIRFVNKAHVKKAHEFYEKHGGMTIFFARFMPIIRTYVPFVAGVSSMQWKKFTLYNAVSAVVWVGSLLGGGYFFGALPVVKNHFSLVIYAIMAVSLLPLVYTLIFARKSGT